MVMNRTPALPTDGTMVTRTVATTRATVMATTRGMVLAGERRRAGGEITATQARTKPLGLIQSGFGIVARLAI